VPTSLYDRLYREFAYGADKEADLILLEVSLYTYNNRHIYTPYTAYTTYVVHILHIHSYTIYTFIYYIYTHILIRRLYIHIYIQVKKFLDDYMDQQNVPWQVGVIYTHSYTYIYTH
jgi:hypothetical protein